MAEGDPGNIPTTNEQATRSCDPALLLSSPALAAGPSGEPEMGRPSEMLPALALRLARALATAHGGAAELTPLPGQGSVLQITCSSVS